jgi:gamma-tubulin complex component 2
MGTPIHRTPQRTPKTYLDESFADMSTILDRTLPPLEDTTPNNKQFVSHPTTKNESILLEDYYCYSDDQQTSQPSSSSMDAACLQNQSTVLLRSCSSNTTIQVSNNNNDKENHLALPADPSGLCLGRPEEVLAIDKTGTDTSLQLRHGDTICLVFGGSFSLGVKKTASSSSSSSSMELAFHHKDAIGGKADHHWTILLVKPGKKVLVGRAAVAANNRKSNRTNGKPICSGDPILLRHVPTGGVLSMNSTELKLVTDSYASQQAQDPSLMDRLHHHDQLLPSKDEVFQLLLSSTPPCPPWLVSGSSSIDERIFLTGSYLLHPQRHQAEFEYQMSQEDRMELSSSIKEKILIDEVIGSFLGLEGRHIKIQPQGPINGGGDASSSTASLGLESFSFQLFGTDGVDFDRSLRNLVEQILPMSTSYVRVQNFISSHHPGYEYGRVMQAFCEGLDALLQDYVNFVVQMERQHRKYKKADSSLTMKSIYFQITPSLHSMSILEHATRAVREKKGGALINALWSLEKLVYMGDMVAKKVLGILLEKSSIPYVEMMSAWLQSGRLADPYGEFMVQRSTDKSNVAEFDGDAWMALFSVNEDHILEGVTSDKWTKEKILTTGKYWNAVHACHVDVDKMQGDVQKIPRLPFNSDSSAILSYIDAMYQNASRVLVQLMKDDFKLKESLLVMKRYFLLDQGDFVTHFLDRAEEELRKQSEDVSVSRIQNWLNLSIQLTEAHREDAHGANNRCPLIPQGLRCRFSGKSLVSYLDSLYGDIVDRTPLTPSRQAYGMPKQGNTGIEVFAIDFPRIPFPISLILSQHAMGNYKLLFRHLFFTKHVERRRIGVWRDHQILKKLDSLRGLLGPTFLLRQRMLHFVQNLLYYMSFEVIDNNWAEMISSIDKSNDPKNNDQQTVDDILNVHNAFLQRTLEACLLTNQELIRSLTKLLNTCLLFTDQMKRFMDTTKIVSQDNRLFSHG